MSEVLRRHRGLLWLGLAGVAAALLAVGYNLWRIEADIESVPPGAVVRIDGRGLGMTPLTVDLQPGRHRLELDHPHYQPEILTLDVQRGDRIQRRVELRRGVGRLSLLSNPKGAWVELDGQRLDGVTPMEVEAHTGPVEVRMGLTERRPQEKTVIVLADQTLEVNLPLGIDPHGSLTVATVPGDARVRFPELDIDYHSGVRIPIGEQLIEVSRTGYETQQIRFDVRYGENRTSVRLNRSFGTLRVRTTPADALVRLTYEAEPGRTATLPFETGARLPVGPVEVSVRAFGYRTAHRTVQIGPDGATLDVALTPMNVKAGETFRDRLNAGGEGPLMVVVPPGRFIMGDPDGPPSVRPATPRILSQPFAVSVNEVSVAEFGRFAAATGFAMDDRLDIGEEPMRYVSWKDAEAYADWLTQQTGQKYRLPTEAEWEYVARAGTDSAYWFGDDEQQLCEFANLADQSARRIYRDWSVIECDDGFEKLAPVSAFPVNPFGVRNVYGNVSEWVQECGIPPYEEAPEDGSLINRGQSCATHGIRGGAWDGQPEALRSTRRGFSRDRGDDKGIRLVKEL